MINTTKKVSSRKVEQPTSSVINQFRTRNIRRIFMVLFFLFSVISAGTLGYMHFEGWKFLEALYMTIITLTTIGFGEVHPLSDTGRTFTIALIIFGMGVFIYSSRVLIEIIFEYEFFGILERKRMEKKIAALSNHYIVCGFGRMGVQIAEDLFSRKLPFVVIENLPEKAEELQQTDYLYIIGNAQEDATLLKAGLDRAKALLSAVGTDADNLYITLTARVLAPHLRIASRANDLISAEKLQKAGADHVVSPYVFGSRRLVASVVTPNVVEFLDSVMTTQNMELQIQEIDIAHDSSLVNKTLGEAHIRSKTGAAVVAIKRANGALETNPTANAPIRPGDLLLCLGTPENLTAVRILASRP